MGNSIEYECSECHYWEAIHGIGGYDYRQGQFKKCSFCTKPIRESYFDFAEKRGKNSVQYLDEGHGISQTS